MGYNRLEIKKGGTGKEKQSRLQVNTSNNQIHYLKEKENENE